MLNPMDVLLDWYEGFRRYWLEEPMERKAEQFLSEIEATAKLVETQFRVLPKLSEAEGERLVLSTEKLVSTLCESIESLKRSLRSCGPEFRGRANRRLAELGDRLARCRV